MLSPERNEIVGERGAELRGAVWCDFERWSEHPHALILMLHQTDQSSHKNIDSKMHFLTSNCIYLSRNLMIFKNTYNDILGSCVLLIL